MSLINSTLKPHDLSGLLTHVHYTGLDSQTLEPIVFTAMMQSHADVVKKGYLKHKAPKTKGPGRNAFSTQGVRALAS